LSACGREDERGMQEYLKALACVDGLRCRGVALNEDSEPGQHKKRPRMQLSFGDNGQQVADGFLTRKRGGKTIHIRNAGALHNMAENITDSCKKDIMHANEKFLVGLLGCMCDNPIGIRSFLNMYEDFMRIESGAEISHV
jgi:hypothetical protein